VSQLTLTRSQARLVMLSAQGLLQAPSAEATPAAVLDCIRRMGQLQIDTIHVVARSPYLVLWSRLGQYEPAWLDKHLAQGHLFEYWSHAACFLPIEDYPLHRRMNLEGKRNYWSRSWYEAHQEDVDRVLEHVRQNGEVRSRDFERSDGKKGTWWDWKIEKQALEYWLTAGELMVARRENFQRVYNLRERILPEWRDEQAPPLEETLDSLVLRSVQALGVARAGWVADTYRLSRRETPARVRALAEARRLETVRVEGWDEPCYLHPTQVETAERAAAGQLEATLTTLLSPFDPLVCDRDRAEEFFDFDYTIECYLPAEKRKYGYFSLPILHRGALVGRLDAKANRQTGTFEVRSLHLEPGAALEGQLQSDLQAALQRCADWHKTPKVAGL
jgi:uncharacterized protein